ncbi:conserved hypothetical protein [Candidatus Terasakiella magnetica]|nr:conserved hypothetical protein [Candidatus Terasakiella magnetica]
MSFVRPLYMSFAIGLASLSGDLSAHAQSSPDGQKRLEAIIATAPLVDPTSESRALREFYRSRNGQLAWSGPQEALGDSLLQEMQAIALAEGLDPGAYALHPTGSDAEHDVMVGAILLRFGRDLAVGAVQPLRAYGGSGTEFRAEFDGPRFLKSLADGTPLAEQANALTPHFAGYLRLKEVLAQTRAQVRAGGWPAIADGPKIQPGESDDRVVALRRRLIATGELAATLAEGREMDAPVVEAVKRFQARHGLDPDGTIGAKTLATLNIPAEARARQIAVNMERWRWMTRNPGRNHIAVNIPAYQLDVVEDGAIVMSMRVVTGDVKHPTPSMNTTLNSLVLNPAWSVPSSIANKEILPKLRRDPHYLSTSNLKITAYPEDSPEAAGDGIDWNGIGKKFPYRLRQPPGPDNALGQLKFNLKDSDDIYMHDTPNRKVFGRSYRALSHGCVRLERPVDLGELLLGERWSNRLGDDLSRNRATRTYMLERTIPVYLLYWTAWSDDEGRIHFRDDIYGHDHRLAPVLERARVPAQRMALNRP